MDRKISTQKLNINTPAPKQYVAFALFFPLQNSRPLTTNVSPAPHRLNASNRLSPERLFQVIPCLKLATYNTSFVDCFNQTFFKFNETKCVTFHQLQP